MKKRIALILVLMSVCVTGITCLQLYWNYQNYKTTVKTFKHDVNEALDKAVNREMDVREKQIVKRFKGWLADTSFITITCNTQNRNGNTVFNMKDTHPYPGSAAGVSLSINDFRQKLNHITPEAKAVFINHMGDSTLRQHLKQGSVFFYTQKLGDSLEKVVDASRHNNAVLRQIYREELLSLGIDAPFEISPKKTGNAKPFLTRTVNAGLQRPHQKDLLFAAFPSPGSYFLSQMKWLLVSSLFLIGITIFCFGYTVKTILTQQKLADLKNDFVNNMTHELKTPVATINIAAEAIQDFNLSKDSANEYLGIIRNQAGNLSQLIDQILKSVIAEQDSLKINLEPVNITGIVNQVIYNYTPQINAAKATVIYEATDDRAMISADPSLIKNAIANLLDNAIKYGGRIIRINQFTENDTLFISIKDNGPGIPEAYHDKVFDRFFRVPSGDIHNVKGYGLGLSYANSIIKKHGGLLKLTGKNEGTEFIISIPNVYHEAAPRIIA